MQITSREITVLTPDGEFIKMNKERKDYQLGEEIPIEVHESRSRRLKGSWKLKILVSGLVATLLVVLSFIPILLSNSKVSAYVSMDVNSSVELGITEELKVVEVKGINLEGKQIIEKLEDWKGQNMENVISEIVSLNETAGHFRANSNLLFSTVLMEKDQQLDQSLQKGLKDVENMIQQKNHSVKIELKKATVKDRTEAENKGISTGTYLKITPKKPKTDSSSKNKENDKVADSPRKEASDYPEPSEDEVKLTQPASTNSKPVNVQKSFSKEENKQETVKEKETKKVVPDQNQGIVKQIPRQEPAKNNDHKPKKNNSSSIDPNSNQKVTNENIRKEQKANSNVNESENNQTDVKRKTQQKNPQQEIRQNRPDQNPQKSPKWQNNQPGKNDIHKKSQNHPDPIGKHDGHRQKHTPKEYYR